MTSWYADYASQAWYGTTFLVRRPDQIAQCIGHEPVWNNLRDSGCNFTCLAMIVGIDPARMSSLLATRSYFLADSGLPARNLAGKRGGLVWDQNAPNALRTSFLLEEIWHPSLRCRTTVQVSFVSSVTTATYQRGKELISSIRAKGDHVICGPQAHSHLVAGVIGDDFFVWDPDDTQTSVEQNLSGALTLRELYSRCHGKEIELWRYRCEFS